ncbi:MAG TPA: NAD(P)H-dependent oxidoreductase [Bryobacteraceae bacterium]|jgi:multimeric flavodoxin WrbA|nr:NAD(P)H-dependent oxidoreductase [Bryobacteraceae bacterium]
MPTKALAFNCTLKSAKGGQTSSTEKLLGQLAAELRKLDVETEIVRAVDHDIKPGTDHDMGSGDAWPALREKLLGADIVVIATPIWLGQPSSLAKRVLERIDAFIEELDDKSRMKTFGKVGLVVVVGNEDGAHHVAAEIYQALNDLGFSLPPTAVTYWVGEAMTGKEYSEFDRPPEKVATATAMAAAGAAHLAKVLKANPYPGNKA